MGRQHKNLLISQIIRCYQLKNVAHLAQSVECVPWGWELSHNGPDRLCGPGCDVHVLFFVTVYPHPRGPAGFLSEGSWLRCQSPHHGSARQAGVLH